jgi:hypothetical protein
MSGRLALYMVLAGCAVFAAIIVGELVFPIADEALVIAAPMQAAVALPAPRQQSGPTEDALASILARPLFSATRRPPAKIEGPASTDPGLAGTRLTGIVTEPGRRIAIFAVSGAKPLRLTEGESVTGWRIDSITPQEISLTGPNGTKTLQPTFDPTRAVASTAAGAAPPPPQPIMGDRVPPPQRALPAQISPAAPARALGRPVRGPAPIRPGR